ncbi:MAG: glutamate mutase L [Pseudoflavonifractor sp.]
MDANLLIYDVGSTYTKASAFALENGRLTFLLRGQAPTTLENVMEGADGARRAIEGAGIVFSPDLKCYSTCSAAGGLKMVAMGYMPRVTAKAAKEVAMSAGARVLEVISYEDPPEYRAEVLREIKPDIILLAGGTDGGDRESVKENANIICNVGTRAMVIVACNRDSQADAAAIFDAHEIRYQRVPNIMPTIHELNVKPAREAIHSQFIRQLTKAKGLDKLTAILADQTVMPTPGAVLMAGELFARGTYEQAGAGSTLIVDIGGATTDIHSMVPALEKLRSEERGLVINNEKQFSYRTVEGNLGMRVSATGIVDAVGGKAIQRLLPAGLDLPGEEIAAYARHLELEPKTIAETPQQKALDRAFAITAAQVGLRRHAGYISQEFDPLTGVTPGFPMGRDLRLAENLIAVGGVFAYTDAATRRDILVTALANPGPSLLPTNPQLLCDDAYVLYAMGVLSQHYPDAALTYMKEHLTKL